MRISIRASGAPEAVVHAVPEGQVPGRAAADVEDLGRIDEPAIPVGRGQGCEDELSGRDGHAGDLHLGGGDAGDRGVHDGQPAQQLLDGGSRRRPGSSRTVASWSG